MALNYAVVTRERMSSEWDGTKRLSAKYLPSTVATAIENGNVVVLGAQIVGEREVYTATTPAVDSLLAAIGLVTTPEVLADERLKNLTDFRNEAGDVLTVDKLVSGNIFSVTKEAYTAAATVAVGDIVELAASTKLKVVAKATGLTSGSTQVGTIVDILNGNYAIQVV